MPKELVLKYRQPFIKPKSCIFMASRIIQHGIYFTNVCTNKGSLVAGSSPTIVISVQRTQGMQNWYGDTIH